jgi:hypothetical protein
MQCGIIEGELIDCILCEMKLCTEKGCEKYPTNCHKHTSSFKDVQWSAILDELALDPEETRWVAVNGRHIAV